MGRAKRPVQILREAMARKDWGAVELAARSGVDVTLIRRYLNEEVEVGAKNAPRLARALGVEPALLLFGECAA